jgi:hypothetical protein
MVLISSPGGRTAVSTQIECEKHAVGFPGKLTDRRLPAAVTVMTAAAEIGEICGLNIRLFSR